MSIRRRFPNPILAALHPGILPGGVRRILLVGEWDATAAGLLASLRRAFPEAGIFLLTPTPGPSPGGIAEMWIGSLADAESLARARAAALDFIVPVEPYGLMGDVRPDLERFALAAGARAVAVYETIYMTVRIATRGHLRYRVYLRPWACRAFGAATLAFVVAPLYGVYLVARWVGLWQGRPSVEDEA